LELLILRLQTELEKLLFIKPVSVSALLGNFPSILSKPLSLLISLASSSFEVQGNIYLSTVLIQSFQPYYVSVSGSNFKITATGSSFHSFDTALRSRLSASSRPQIVWVADYSVVCSIPAGRGAQLTLIISQHLDVMMSSSPICYSNILVSSVFPLNSPTSGSISVG